MHQAEDPAEELIGPERKQSDRYDEHDRENGCGNPFFTRRPRYAPKLQPNATHKILRVHLSHGSFFGVRRSTGGLIHHEDSPRDLKLAGRTGLEPATGDFGDRYSTN
jgi:hypothetical protein